MLTFEKNTHFARLVWVIVACVFVADLLVPRHYDIVFGYLLAHFLAVFFREKSDVMLLAVVTSALSIVVLVIKPQDAPLEQMLLERAPAIVSFWAAAFFVIKFMRLREEEELQEGRFKALFAHANQGILLANRSGEIVMANPSVEQLFGYQPGELIGNKIEILIPNRFASRHVGHRTSFHKNPNARPMGIGLSLFGKKKDGSELPVEVSLSPFRIHENEYVVAFVVDNTIRKNNEHSILKQKQELSSLSQALRELNESLENKVSERTEELEQAKNELKSSLDKERELGELKSRFVSMASHEFRTPLTSVLSSSGLIQQYADRQDIANIKKHAERIRNAVNGLNTILTEFLSLGRLEEGRVSVNPERTDMGELIQDVHETLRNLFKSGQTFVHNHSGESLVFIDANLTKNILINLISNAIKYSPEGAPITVESSVAAGEILIKVIDRGMGIPYQDQKHLFDRFFRASNAVNTTQGTGLGLYIVQRYAEMMGGVVGYESAVEEGSTFWVRLKS